LFTAIKLTVYALHIPYIAQQAIGRQGDKMVSCGEIINSILKVIFFLYASHTAFYSKVHGIVGSYSSHITTNGINWVFQSSLASLYSRVT
jgi:hypothetical protein